MKLVFTELSSIFAILGYENLDIVIIDQQHNMVVNRCLHLSLLDSDLDSDSKR